MATEREQQPADQGRGVGEFSDGVCKLAIEARNEYLNTHVEHGLAIPAMRAALTAAIAALTQPKGIEPTDELIETFLADRMDSAGRVPMVKTIKDALIHFRTATGCIDCAYNGGLCDSHPLPPMQAPMPTIADAEAAIDTALADALKAVKVLYTMLHKVNLPGFAVADEVAASIVYAQKMRAALSLPRQSEADEGSAWDAMAATVNKPRFWARYFEGGAGWTPWNEITKHRYEHERPDSAVQRTITRDGREPQ